MALTSRQRKWAVAAGTVVVLAATGVFLVRRSSRVPMLVARLSHPNVDVRREAAVKLGEIGEPAVEPLIEILRWFPDRPGGSDRRNWFSRALGINFTRRRDSPNVRAVVQALVFIGEPAVDDLVRIARGGWPAPRPQALLALKMIKCKAGMDALCDLAERGRPEIRRDAILYLLHSGSPRARSLLNRAANDSSMEVRRTALFVLSRRCDPQASETLVDALMDDDPAVGQLVMLHLPGRNADHVIHIIRSALQSPHELIRWHAACELERRKIARVEESAPDLAAAADFRKLARDYIDVINQGRDQDIWPLVIALERHGDIDMAVALHMCYQRELDIAARRWARAHGLSGELRKRTRGREDGLRWGGVQGSKGAGFSPLTDAPASEIKVGAQAMDASRPRRVE